MKISEKVIKVIIRVALIVVHLLTLTACIHQPSLSDNYATELAHISAQYTTSRLRVLKISEAKNNIDNNEEAYQKAVGDLWRSVQQWTVSKLNGSGDKVDPEDIVKYIEQLDPPRKCSDYDNDCFEEFHLSAQVLDLNTKGHPTYVVSVNYPRMGTFFIVTKDDRGFFSATWNIHDLALKHYSAKDEIGYWAFLNSIPYSDAPLVGSAYLLPPGKNGNARFYVDAFAALEAGGTGPKQISIWEYKGKTVEPLLIRTYSWSNDSGEIAFTDGELRIPTKGHYKTFFSCGMCTEPLEIWKISITPDGVFDLGKQDAIPELRLVDELWDRVIKHADVSEIATSAVAKTIHNLFESLKAENEQYGKFDSLSMIGSYKVFDDKAGKHLYFQADNLNCNELRFIVKNRNGALYFSELTIQNICEDSNECQKSLP